MTRHGQPNRLDTAISVLIRAALGGIILFSSLLLFVNVVMRYVFLAPIFWAEELARYLMVWLIFLGAGEVAGGEGHISVDALIRSLSPRAKALLSCLSSLISLSFCIVLTYYGWRHAMRVRLSAQVTAALDLPMWWAYMAIPVGSALMALRYAQRLTRRKRENA